MLVLLLAAAVHSIDNSGSGEIVYKVVDGSMCFPPLGIVRSAIMLLLAGSMVAFAGTSFSVILKFCRHSASPQEFAS
jgi:hypothetical protein